MAAWEQFPAPLFVVSTIRLAPRLNLDENDWSVASTIYSRLLHWYHRMVTGAGELL
jgi:hypothetical protein